ncbi:MAG: flagellar motor switch protein FliG [Acidimicrobiales bacterium]
MSEQLSGAQKAAVLLAQVDESRAEQVLQLLSESEVIILMNEMAHLPALETSAIKDVMHEFTGGMASMLAARQGGPDVAKALLTETFGSEHAEEMFAHVVSEGNGPAGSLRFLDRLDASVVASMLSDEHPQIVALVLTNLAPAFAAQVIQHLEPSTRTDLAQRIARMGKVAPEAVATVVSMLDRRFSALILQHGDGPVTGGVQDLVDILNNSERAVEKQVLVDLQDRNPELAEEVHSLMFSFEDVSRLDDVTLQKVLRRVSPKELAVALRAVDEATRDKFLHNMSERAASDLQEEIELLGPIRVSLVENAQSQVAKIVRDLEAAGDIVLPRSNDGEEVLL